MFRRVIAGIATVAVAGAFWAPLFAYAGGADTQTVPQLQAKLGQAYMLLGRDQATESDYRSTLTDTQQRLEQAQAQVAILQKQVEALRPKPKVEAKKPPAAPARPANPGAH